MQNTSNYLIVFADLVGSTDVASEVTPSFYAETYVASFHWAARKAEEYIKNVAFPRDTFNATIQEIHIAGDEVLSFTQMDVKNKGKKISTAHEDIVGSAVAFAYVTKLYWLASPYNLRRMLDHQFPRDVAVGIHLGPAALVPDRDSTKSQIASLHINVAKRIEGLARGGSESRIYASYDVAELFKAWADRHQNMDPQERSPLTYATFEDRTFLEPIKGLPKPIRVHELSWPPSNQEALMNLLHMMTTTPEMVDHGAEEAAKKLAEQYLASATFFRYETGVLAVLCQVPNSRKAEDYIERWFSAVSGPTKLFFDECWLVLNAFIISCAFIRHKEVTEEHKRKYNLIIKKLLKRLQDLHIKKKTAREEQYSMDAAPRTIPTY